MDMSEAYITVVTQKVPQAQIVFDRFHVQQLVHAALDEDAARGMATPAGRGRGGGQDGQGPPVAAPEKPLEPDAQAGATPLDVAAG